MIYAMLDTDCSIYPEAIQEALHYLKNHDMMAMKPGKYPIHGDKMFAVVVDVELGNIYTVKPEAHRTYIDVQYWSNRAPRFGCFPLTAASNIEAENPEQDVWYYEAEVDESFVIARPGSFAIFFPEDVHRPDLCANGPECIRKCVVKIDVSLLSERAEEITV